MQKPKPFFEIESLLQKANILNWVKGVLPASILIIFFIISVYLLGWLPRFFYGEDFFLYQYAQTPSFLEAIKLYFQENGRLFEGVYWVSTYKLIGYQPIWMHVSSLTLNLITVVLASFAIYTALPKTLRRPITIFGFSVFTFFMPHVINWAFRLSGDNSRITLITFFLSVIFIQKWASSNFKVVWLFLGLLSFILGVFTYENIALLFPSALLLALPLIPRRKLFEKKLIIGLGLLAIGSLFIEIIPIVIYKYLAALYGPGFTHPSVGSSGFLTTLPQRFGELISYLANYIINSNLGLQSPSWIGNLLSLIFLLIILCATVVMIIAARKYLFMDRTGLIKSEQSLVLVSIYLSAIWISVMGIVPYALGSHYSSPPVRYYSSAIYGISILFAMIFTFSTRYWLKNAMTGLLLIIVVLGLNEFRLYSNTYRQLEYLPENDYLSLIEIVPAVEQGTSFFFIDNQMGNSPVYGCGIALSILYNTENIRCAFLSSTNYSYRAERTANRIIANEGGLFNDGNWVIVGIKSDGSKYVVPEINPSDKLLIQWDITEPIRTDFRRITSDKPLKTQMYKYLLERKQELDRDKNATGK